MAVKSGLTITDHISFDDIRAKLAGLQDQQVVVGVTDKTSGRKDGEIDNAALGYIHEFGAPAANIPARPFLVPGVEEQLGPISDLMERGAQRVLDGQIDADRVLSSVGLQAQGDVQQKIASGPFAPLKPATIRRKGSSRPLIDTGALRQAITWEIRKK